MNFKKFLPVENYTLKTKLSVEEVRNRIANKIEPKKNFRLTLLGNNSSKPYEGILVNNKFTISRIINYRNSFLPVITGSILNGKEKTMVKINMQLQKFVLIFVAFWIGSVVIALVMQILSFLNKSAKTFSLPLIISFGSIIFLGLLTFFAFKKESKISKEFLARLIEGEELTA